MVCGVGMGVGMSGLVQRRQRQRSQEPSEVLGPVFDEPHGGILLLSSNPAHHRSQRVPAGWGGSHSLLDSLLCAPLLHSAHPGPLQKKDPQPDRSGPAPGVSWPLAPLPGPHLPLSSERGLLLRKGREGDPPGPSEVGGGHSGAGLEGALRTGAMGWCSWGANPAGAGDFPLSP